MKKIVYIDMDDVLCKYKDRYNQMLEIKPEIKYPQSQYGFFVGLEVMKDAHYAMHLLRWSEQYDPYILTAPSIKNPLCYTEKRVWVEKYFGMYFVERLIISPNKSLLMGDYLIDDNVFGKGQEGFKGELLQFGSEKYPDWQSILKYLNIDK